MSRNSALLLGTACAMVALASCGKGGARAAVSPHRAAQTASADIGNACDRKLLTTADVATVVSDPVTGTKPIAGTTGSCEFTTAGMGSVMVSLRPGTGRASLAVWKSGRMPVPGTPLAGVGDEAVWVNELTEVVAEKNDLLCDIQVTGLPAVLNHQPAEAKQKAIGALCNKIFAAAR